MKKNLIALAVAAVMAPGFAAAEGASISGFADITYSNGSDIAGGATAGDSDSVFNANGEIDVRNTMGAVTVGVDVDLYLHGAVYDAAVDQDSATLEQAFFAWKATDAVTVIGGVFNNPIGWDAEDAPDMDMTSHTLSYNALDAATDLYGNNIAGVAAAFAAGPATITAAVLNDIGHRDDTGAPSTEDHSFAVVANFAAMEGLNVELGYVTQNNDVTGVGNVADINATFNQGPLTVKADYMMPSEIVDSILGIYGRYNVTDQVGVAARYEVASPATGDDTTATTLYANYKLADNLVVAAEWRSEDDGADKTDATTLEFIAKF